MAQIGAITVKVDLSKARRRVALIERLPVALRRVIPFGLALWWVVRGVKVWV